MGDSPSGCRRDDSGTFWTWGARPGSICRSETHRHDSVLGQVLWPPRELAAECDLFARNCKKTTVPETLNSPWWGCDTHYFSDCDVRRYGRLLANPILQVFYHTYSNLFNIYGIFYNHYVYCQHVTTSPMSTVLKGRVHRRCGDRAAGNQRGAASLEMEGEFTENSWNIGYPLVI